MSPTIRVVITGICVGAAGGLLQPKQPQSLIASALLVVAILVAPVLYFRRKP